ncbi:stalk domain-containing protein [Candidatus Formimonas warabiya]|uniref:Copper amine oxidase-like N-terminal domain-containing protein n=1 Tax=Formimonas warabiya TaxID=1761012 RepID=A0A3G1KN52_FORW1|nr:stalk domain-containing protein [Candidatus Formimonas warabiya]ATW23893.1 hypothetical protein DCMF_02970 [Candidatus Formimonas warabiya]
MKKWILILTLLSSLSFVLFNPLALAAAPTSHIQSFEASSLIKSDGSYWVWGNDLQGNDQSVPVQVYGLTEVEKSFDNQLVMKKDRTVWFWERTVPSGAIQIYPVKSLNNLIDVQSAWSEILTLDKEGKVYLLSTQGKLDPDKLNQIMPLSGIDNVADISSYYEYHPQSTEMRWVFLKKDGTVWKSKGSIASNTFEQIPSLDTVTDIEANIALKQDGTVWSWPNETDNDPVEAFTATPIIELTGIRSIKAFGNVYIAIDHKNTLWFWGATVTGASDGTQYHLHPNPIQLTNMKDVQEAFAAERSLMVLTSRGDVYQTSLDRETMPGNPLFDYLTSNVQQIKAGSRHIILQKKDGSLWGWGVNKNGQLGCGDFSFMYSDLQPVQKPVSVYLNDQLVVMNSGVIIRNGQAFIPLRSVFEEMGAVLNWDGVNKTVTINRTEPGIPPVTIGINYASGKVYLNQEPVQLLNNPFILVSTSYLPLRFISEALGGKVEWIQDEDKILISLP